MIYRFATTSARYSVVLLTAALVLLISGCKSSKKHHASAVGYYDSGRPDLALTSLIEADERRRAEHDIIAIDRALAELMNGNAPTCEATLRSEKKRLEHLQQKDLREQTTALLTDDKAVAWTGREFEQRMIDGLLILSSLVGNRHDAFAHSTVAMDAIHADQQMLKPEHSSEIVTVSSSEETVPLRRA